MQNTITKACLIPTCSAEKFSLVHKFPADNERFEEWINAIQKERPIAKLAGMTDEAIRKRFFVCSRHFSPQQYKNAESRSLNLTAVPALNLINLNEIHLSKAAQTEPKNMFFDGSIASVKPETSLQKPAVVTRVLNTAAPNPHTKSPKQIVRIIKTTHKVAQPTVMKDVKPIVDAISQETQLETVEEPPPAKRFRTSLNSENSCSLFPSYEKSLVDNRKEELISNNVPDKTISAGMATETIADSEPPKNKLLALIEVTPEQYEKLSSTLSTNDRSENVRSLLNFIDNNELDPSAADNELTIELPNGSTLKADFIWLRDHCRCSHCYDSSTNQRKTNLLEIADDIKTKSFEVKDEKLFVIWNDEHMSSYDLSFLVENLSDEKTEFSDICLWNKSLIDGPLKQDCRVTMRDYMSDQNVSKNVLKSLHLYGVAIIDGVQPTQQNTEFVIRQLFPVHKTFFGEMWTFSDAAKTHSDTAYTNIYLGPHTDNTYFNDAAGLQILHCIQSSCIGGENFLVDGFRVAENIKANHPEIFDRLTKTIVTAEYIEDGRHHKHSAPIINLCPVTKQLMQIRFNLHDRAPLKPTGNVRQFYSDLKILAQEFEDPENRIVFKLEPGKVLIFDNWRVLHGRQAYTGKRTMTGCYVARTE